MGFDLSPYHLAALQVVAESHHCRSLQSPSCHKAIHLTLTEVRRSRDERRIKKKSSRRTKKEKTRCDKWAQGEEWSKESEEVRINRGSEKMRLGKCKEEFTHHGYSRLTWSDYRHSRAWLGYDLERKFDETRHLEKPADFLFIISVYLLLYIGHLIKNITLQEMLMIKIKKENK